MKKFTITTLLLLVSIFDASSFIGMEMLHRRAGGHLTHYLTWQDLDDEGETPIISRRFLFQSAIFTVATSATAFRAAAATRPPLRDLLYTVLRVREATTQETRLIKSGKFKDVQRANVKLAVKFMVQNYRLADTVVAASAYLEGNDRRVEAGQVGQSAVQNLITILEYFDSSDVQNLKVGSMDNMSGKEQLVLKGLEATRKSIDQFLTYFPAEEVAAAKAKVKEENELNVKEFDKAMGEILNLPPADS